MSFFSVIIPTYNSSSTIQESLSSILSQTFTDFEILIIDGLSKDKTIAIAENFCDQRIKIFSESDEGVYDAMNKGLKIASGEWLYFLGSDDYMSDRFVLRDVANFIESNSNVKVLYGNVCFFNEKPIWAKNKDVYDGEFSFKKLTVQNICHQAIFYNRQFIVSNRFTYNLKFPICADWDFNIRCWLKSEFYYINQNIVYFSGGGLSSNRSDNFEKEKDWLIAKYSSSRLKYFFNLFGRFLVKLLHKIEHTFK